MTRLNMDARQTTLTTTDPAMSVMLGLGYLSVAETFFRHDPPTPGELERAIDAVEDALMSARASRTDADTLVTSSDIGRFLPDLPSHGAAATLEEVEARFQRLASVSLGHPRTLADKPLDRESAAGLLILRECMHHLGFGTLTTAEEERTADKSTPLR
jgi:exopolyphosphatase/pppGpp-phosphohydrolase